MSGRAFTHASRATTDAVQVQRAPESVAVSTPGDRHELEADRVADAVTRGGAVHDFSITRLGDAGGDGVQRQEAAKPSAEEKQREAALKAAEAFLATSYGKQLKDAVANDPVVSGVSDAAGSFVSTLPGKVVTGAVAAGVVTALGVAGQGLPLQVPEIPLDRVTPGLSVKVVYEGAVFSPSKATITFSYKPPAAKGGAGGGASDSDRYRGETAKLAADQAKFQAGLRYAPGSAEARAQEAQDAAARNIVGLGRLPGQGSAPKASLGFDGGSNIGAPRLGELSGGFKPKPISLLDEELQLKPLTAPASATEQKRDPDAGVQRKADGEATSAPAADVHRTMAASGSPLDARTRSTMEARFGRDFGGVRVHTDASAGTSARSMHALAYTTGADIAFAPGQFDPHSRRGQHLIAHELAHVVQQTGGTPAPLVQRRSALESIGIFFGVVEGTFSDKELLDYLEKVKLDKKIEGSYDSDNKARAIVKRWKAGDTQFNLIAPQKVMLIKEMLDGPTLDDDEQAILDLLESSDNVDLRLIFGAGGVTLAELDDDLHGDEQKRLDTFADARFKGGRTAVEAGTIEPLGNVAAGAPTFPYDWTTFKAKISSGYQVRELVAEASALSEADQATLHHDLIAERTTLEQDVANLDAQWAAETDPEQAARLETQRNVVAAKRQKTEVVLETLFRDIARETPGQLRAKAVDPTAAQQADIKATLKPPVAVSSGGIPLPFESTLPGESKSYEDKLRAGMPALIQAYWDAQVKGRGTAEHSDPDKVHTLKEMEDIGNVAKKETDAVFGGYYDANKHPQLTADTKKKRGNIHDLFADTEKDLGNMTKGQRRTMARQLLFYFFQSDRNVRKLNDAHHASPSFDKKDKPQNDEAKVLVKLADEFTSTAAQVQKLNEIDRGWDASASPATRDINIQVFRKPTAAGDRDFLWDMFQTLIHEYMHTLVSDQYSKYADSFGGSSNENNTLMEGMDCVLAETVWANIEPRVQDPALRAAVEGPVYSKMPPIEVEPASRRRYPSFTEAMKLVNIVGVRNVYLAYFMGDVKKIGG